jgi:hypothetical protein
VVHKTKPRLVVVDGVSFLRVLVGDFAGPLEGPDFGGSASVVNLVDEARSSANKSRPAYRGGVRAELAADAIASNAEMLCWDDVRRPTP